MSARYIKEEKNGVYEGVLLNNWQVIGVETDSPYRQDVVELVNADILEIPSIEEGKVTNIASINVSQPVKSEDIEALAKKAEVPVAKLGDITTTGELYKAVNEARQK